MKYWSKLGREGREARSGMTDWEIMEGQRTSPSEAHNNPSDKQFNQPNFEDEEPEALRCEVTCLVRYLEK